MSRILWLAFLLSAPALAQRNDMWSNPGLSQRGVPVEEQRLTLRQDMSHCHGAAFDRTREVEDAEKRKALGVALFRRCMAEKGWSAREPGQQRKPATKAPRETST